MRFRKLLSGRHLTGDDDGMPVSVVRRNAHSCEEWRTACLNSWRYLQYSRALSRSAKLLDAPTTEDLMQSSS
jgi:hypothetical protein